MNWAGHPSYGKVAAPKKSGKALVRQRMHRDTVIDFCAKSPPCVVAMEARWAAHHMGQSITARGHAVRLMSPEYVRPCVKAQKNDDRDAKAKAETGTWPTMRCVQLKSEQQLDMQTLRRVRAQLVGERTCLMKPIRSLLLERRHVAAKRRAKLAALVAELLNEDANQPASPCHSGNKNA